MNNRAQLFGKLLECFSKVTANLSDAELNALIDGDFKIEVAGRVLRITDKKRRVSKPENPNNSALEQAADTLRRSSSTEEGYQFLERHFPSTKSLRSLARYVKVRVEKGDDAAFIAKKIITQTISSRINREVIRKNDEIDEISQEVDDRALRS